MRSAEFRKRLFKGGTAASALIAFAQAVPAYAQEQTYSFDIPAQDLGSALRSFARVSRQQVTFDDRSVQGKRSPALRGSYTTARALSALLKGSGLAAERGRSGLFIVRPIARTSPGEGMSANDLGAYGTGDIDEIVVTAQKREERLIDVPVAITAISDRTLERTGADSFEDYLGMAPGVQFAGISGNRAITIRGITTAMYSANTQSTVDLLFDDAPSLNRYYSRFNTDFRLIDVERVEILRGPQGTLFGSGALAGAVRIVNRKPKADRYEASADASISSVDSGGTSHDLKAMVNLPLATDKLALRVVGYEVRDAGFVDNIVRNEKDVNFVRSYGGRAMLSFTPDDRLNLTAWAWHQRDRSGGDFATFLNPADGGKYQSGSVDPEDAEKARATLLNFTASYKFNRFDLVSSSSYMDRDGRINRDYTTFWQVRRQYFGDVTDYSTAKTEMFNQEVRLSSSTKSPFQWLIGAYYLDQDVDVNYLRTIAGFGAAKNYSSDIISSLRVKPSIREFAGFGEVNYTFLDQLTITAGARWFDNQLEFSSVRGGFEGGAPTPLSKAHEQAVTPRFALAYKPYDDLNIYLQAAKGYRTGQANFSSLADPVTGVFPPASYGPDSLWNYEIGLKTRLYGGKVQLNVAAFYIDWKKIQLTRRNSFTTYTDNAGNARSQGVEAELTITPVKGLTIGISPSYTDAKLTSVADQSTVQPGELPGSPKWSVSNYMQLARPLSPSVDAFVRLDHRYVGSKRFQLEAVPYKPAERSEAYNLINARAGIEVGRFGIDLFVDNLTNSSASLAPRIIGNGTFIGSYRLKPRTIGLALHLDL